MTSQIDPTVPVAGVPTTASQRQNWATAKAEISDLQANKLDKSGGILTGPLTLPQYTATIGNLGTLALGAVPPINGVAEGISVQNNKLVSRHTVAVTAGATVVVPPPASGVTAAVVTMGGVSTVLDIGTGAFDLQPFTVRIDQGSVVHSVTFGTTIAIGSDLVSYIPSAANKSDYLGFVWSAARAQWHFIAATRGF